MSVRKELNTVKDLVISVLAEYPLARNNDTYLYEKCCEKLGGVYLTDITKIGLNMISVHKIRQVIQNKENMYLPTENVSKKRRQRAIDIREYMIEN